MAGHRQPTCGQTDQPPRPNAYGAEVPAQPTRHPTPHADRHLLAWHALTRRQLTTAFLHGSRRSWRERRRIWPVVLFAATIVALLLAGASVLTALTRAG
jgi:hypothetical protein